MAIYTRADGSQSYHTMTPEQAASHYGAIDRLKPRADAAQQQVAGMAAAYALGPNGDGNYVPGKTRVPGALGLGGTSWNTRTGEIMGSSGQYIQQRYPSYMPYRPTGGRTVDQIRQRQWDGVWGMGDLRGFDAGAPAWTAPDSLQPSPWTRQPSVPYDKILGGY